MMMVYLVWQVMVSKKKIDTLKLTTESLRGVSVSHAGHVAFVFFNNGKSTVAFMAEIRWTEAECHGSFRSQMPLVFERTILGLSSFQECDFSTNVARLRHISLSLYYPCSCFDTNMATYSLLDQAEEGEL